MAQAEFIEVQKYLSGVNYPAAKDELVDHAKKQGASKDVIDALSYCLTANTTGPTRSAARWRSPSQH
jgi:hypothetical protein